MVSRFPQRAQLRLQLRPPLAKFRAQGFDALVQRPHRQSPEGNYSISSLYQTFPHWRETFSVDRAGTEAAEGFYVLPGRVAFVSGEAVLGVEAVVGDHHSVSDDFGDDAGGSDEGANFVAVNDEQARNA